MKALNWAKWITTILAVIFWICLMGSDEVSHSDAYLAFGVTTFFLTMVAWLFHLISHRISSSKKETPKKNSPSTGSMVETKNTPNHVLEGIDLSIIDGIEKFAKDTLLIHNMIDREMNRGAFGGPKSKEKLMNILEFLENQKAKLEILEEDLNSSKEE